MKKCSILDDVKTSTTNSTMSLDQMYEVEELKFRFMQLKDTVQNLDGILDDLILDVQNDTDSGVSIYDLKEITASTLDWIKKRNNI